MHANKVHKAGVVEAPVLHGDSGVVPVLLPAASVIQLGGGGAEGSTGPGNSSSDSLPQQGAAAAQGTSGRETAAAGAEAAATGAASCGARGVKKAAEAGMQRSFEGLGHSGGCAGSRGSGSMGLARAGSGQARPESSSLGCGEADLLGSLRASSPSPPGAHAVIL